MCAGPGLRVGGWGGRTRTCKWRLQRPLPYHLATPHERLRIAEPACVPSRTGPVLCGCERLHDVQVPSSARPRASPAHVRAARLVLVTTPYIGRVRSPRAPPPAHRWSSERPLRSWEIAWVQSRVASRLPDRCGEGRLQRRRVTARTTSPVLTNGLERVEIVGSGLRGSQRSRLGRGVVGLRRRRRWAARRPAGRGASDQVEHRKRAGAARSRSPTPRSRGPAAPPGRTARRRTELRAPGGRAGPGSTSARRELLGQAARSPRPRRWILLPDRLRSGIRLGQQEACRRPLRQAGRRQERPSRRAPARFVTAAGGHPHRLGRRSSAQREPVTVPASTTHGAPARPPRSSGTKTLSSSGGSRRRRRPTDAQSEVHLGRGGARHRGSGSSIRAPGRRARDSGPGSRSEFDPCASTKRMRSSVSRFVGAARSSSSVQIALESSSCQHLQGIDGVPGQGKVRSSAGSWVSGCGTMPEVEHARTFPSEITKLVEVRRRQGVRLRPRRLPLRAAARIAVSEPASVDDGLKPACRRSVKPAGRSRIGVRSSSALPALQAPGVGQLARVRRCDRPRNAGPAVMPAPMRDDRRGPGGGSRCNGAQDEHDHDPLRALEDTPPRTSSSSTTSARAFAVRDQRPLHRDQRHAPPPRQHQAELVRGPRVVEHDSRSAVHHVHDPVQGRVQEGAERGWRSRGDEPRRRPPGRRFRPRNDDHEPDAELALVTGSEGRRPPPVTPAGRSPSAGSGSDGTPRTGRGAGDGPRRSRSWPSLALITMASRPGSGAPDRSPSYGRNPGARQRVAPASGSGAAASAGLGLDVPRRDHLAPCPRRRGGRPDGSGQLGFVFDPAATRAARRRSNWRFFIDSRTMESPGLDGEWRWPRQKRTGARSRARRGAHPSKLTPRSRIPVACERLGKPVENRGLRGGQQDSSVERAQVRRPATRRVALSSVHASAQDGVHGSPSGSP